METADDAVMTPSSETADRPGAATGKGARNGLAVALLIGMAATYAAAMLAITFARHDRFGSTTYDLGIFDQATWLLRHGYRPFLTTRGLPVFGDHFSLVLYLLAPLYALWESPKMLLLAQTLALAAGALPVYGIAHKQTGSRGSALLFAAIYLVYPAIGWMNHFDFHPDALATPLLLWLLWAVEARRPRALIAPLILLLLCKETMGLMVAMVGLYAIRPLGRRVGLAVVAAGLVGMALSLAVMHAANGGQPSAYVSLYDQYGAGGGQIALYLLTHPGRLLADLTTPANVAYLLQMAFPVAFLCLLAPRTLLMTVPMLLSNMLSNRPQMHEVIYQYNALTAPVLLLAATQGFRWLLDRAREPGRRAAGHAALECALLVGAFVAYSQGPFAAEAQERPRVSAERAAALNAAIAQVPPQATVSAQTAIAAHMAHRRFIYMYPNPFRDAGWGNSATALRQELGLDLYGEELSITLRRIHAVKDRVEYVLVAPWSDTFPINGEHYAPYVRPILASPDYGVIWAKEGIALLRRGSDHAEGLKRLRAPEADCDELVSILENRR